MKPAGGEEEDDLSLGHHVERLIDDAKAYAEAEFQLARAKAEAKVGAYRTATILFAAAATFGLVALITLFVTLTLALATLVGPLAGGLIATLIALAIAAGLGLAGRKRLDRADG